MWRSVFALTCLTTTASLIADDSALAQKESVNYANNGSFKAKDYSNLLGMNGFSDEALKLHFKLYQGYVTNTNLLLNTLAELTQEKKERSPLFAEIKRRLGWEYDGMRLHEYYFENLGGANSSLDTKDRLFKALEEEYGTFEKWKSDFVATGAMRGIGWAVLYLDPHTGKLLNLWINEHDLGHLAGGKPLLIMDVFEHAYLLDYGTERAKYIEAFFKNIDWKVVSQRFEESQKRK